ncbi:MAG: nitroreductase family protein [Chlorobiaceae bacterium]|nr:nitroreductase family protein [Chlorobiaceae bacterium]NTW10351.1 nitroreductase family protein [Chlorobiaceae bacterium]
MNQTIESILKRRSIRAYHPGQITERELQDIIAAGTYAPTAMGQQPWHFLLLQNPELLEKLQVRCKEMFALSEIPALRQMAANEEFDVFYKAPTLVIVFADPGAIAPLQDSALAMENMMIAAASCGIGSCWVHSVMWLFEKGGGSEAFAGLGISIPEGYKPYAAAVFGYCAQPWPEAGPRKPGMVEIVR